MVLGLGLQYMNGERDIIQSITIPLIFFFYFIKENAGQQPTKLNFATH